MEYKEPDYEYDQQPEYEPQRGKSEMGLKIAISILLVVLIAMSFMFWKRVQSDKADAQALKIEMDTLQNRTQRLLGDMDEMKFDNDTLNRNLMSERHKADSLMTRLKSERQMSYSKLKQYERELGTLRVAMQGFVRQIDSLNRLNHKLTGENIRISKELKNATMKIEIAEETAQELGNKVKKGSQVKVGRVLVQSRNKNDKAESNAKRVAQLVTTFELGANELAEPGERNIYLRIISPEGYDLQENQGAMFNFEGQRTPYAVVRSVDYQGESLAVNMFYRSSGFTPGKYTVYVYMSGVLVGTSDIILK